MRREQALILEEARRRGLSVLALDDIDGAPAALIERGGRVELLVNGAPQSLISQQARHLFWRKDLSKQVFDRIGLPSPRGLVLRDPLAQRAEVEALLAACAPLVAKPVAGMHGDGVATDLVDLAQVCAHHAGLGAVDLILEQQIEGRDLRLHAIGGRLVAACVREPAHVVGDGVQPLSALIEARAALVRSHNPQNRLDLDEAALALIAAQGLDLAAAPAAGRVVWLKRVANVAKGALPVDVTDALHPGFGDWIARVARATRHGFFAMDVIAPDPSAPPEAGAVVLEINHEPNWLHHTFSLGRQHDLPAMILDALFPPEG